MQVKLTGHHVDITDPLRDYVESKMGRVLRHYDQVTDIHCILEVDKLQHKAEATLQVTGDTLFAESVQNDMYAAIDGLIDKLDRQVKKHKEKITEHNAREAQRAARQQG